VPDEAVTLEYLAGNVRIVGDPEDVARKIGALHAGIGATAAVWPLHVRPTGAITAPV